MIFPKTHFVHEKNKKSEIVFSFLSQKSENIFGIVVPITLKKMNIDPAIASSVFVTTITDVIGFVSFLGVSAYFL